MVHGADKNGAASLSAIVAVITVVAVLAALAALLPLVLAVLVLSAETAFPSPGFPVGRTLRLIQSIIHFSITLFLLLLPDSGLLPISTGGRRTR